MRDKIELYARDLVTFTCQVQIQGNVDTSVNVSLTWVREFYGQLQLPEYLTTEHIFNDSSHDSVPLIVTREMTIENLSSLDRRVTCKSVVHPLQEQSYILSSMESSQTDTLDVTGISANRVFYAVYFSTHCNTYSMSYLFYVL